MVQTICNICFAVAIIVLSARIRKLKEKIGLLFNIADWFDVKYKELKKERDGNEIN